MQHFAAASGATIEFVSMCDNEWVSFERQYPGIGYHMRANGRHVEVRDTSAIFTNFGTLGIGRLARNWDDRNDSVIVPFTPWRGEEHPVSRAMLKRVTIPTAAWNDYLVACTHASASKIMEMILGSRGKREYPRGSVVIMRRPLTEPEVMVVGNEIIQGVNLATDGLTLCAWTNHQGTIVDL